MLAGVVVGEKINGDLGEIARCFGIWFETRLEPNCLWFLALGVVTDTLAGMAMVIAGVGLCVNSKV